MTTADFTADLIALIEPLARKFHGEPNYDLSRTYARPNELRFGTNGSLKIDVENGTWYDFEAKAGGGVLDFVKRKTFLTTNREVFEWLEREGFWENKRKGNGKDTEKIVVDSFDYPNRDGALSYVVERIEFQKPDGSFVLNKSGKRKKTFRQKRPDPDKPGEWIYNVDGCPLLLYKLREVDAAIAAGHLIVVPEGEGKVDLLWSWNVPATCNSGGAGNWKKEHAEQLRGADVLILGDNDKVGRKFVETVGTSLEGIAKSVRVLDLPDLGPKEDILDWARKGGTVEAFRELVAQQARPFLTAAQASAQAASLFDPWERFIVPEFPLDILPPVLRDFVTSQSRVIGGCLSGMAMATLAVVSAATSHRWSLKMMTYGRWYTQPRLWVLLVGDPSTKKTPEMDAACAPLERRQAEAARDYKAAVRAWEAAKEDGDKNAEEPEPPPRYVAIDITTQKLGELLARTGAERGLLIKRDELTGWIGEMDRYNNAMHATSDRAFWLKAWDGGYYHYDRINRGELFIENLSVSILGGIQPDRLAELRGLTSDGLLQRFLPIMMTEASFTLDEPTNVNPYWALIRQLVDMPAQRLSMTNAARNTIDELRRYLFELEKNSGGISKSFQAFIGKLAGYTGSLAIVLHLSEFPGERFVGGKVAKGVDRLVREFLIPHAYEFYGVGETGDQLKRLASYVLTCGKDRILASDLTTNIRDFRGLSLFQVHERVSALVAGGWLAPLDRTPTCRAWKVNPAVKLKFAEQAQKEEERKRTITEMLNLKKRIAST